MGSVEAGERDGQGGWHQGLKWWMEVTVEMWCRIMVDLAEKHPVTEAAGFKALTSIQLFPRSMT